MVVRLTDRLVKDLPPPATGNRITFDTEVKGFGLRVTAAGAKGFILNYYRGGIGRRLTIGAFPTWSTSQAREEAKALRRRIDVGEDPLADPKAERVAPTVADLVARYLAEHASRKRPRGLTEDVSLLQRAFCRGWAGCAWPMSAGKMSRRFTGRYRNRPPHAPIALWP
jgi:hypothetical protein